MADIFHQFMINTPVKEVFKGISTPKGLDIWWTKNSAGKPAIKEIYSLSFGPAYNWSGVVSKCVPDQEFELIMANADPEWINTRVGFMLADKGGKTQVHFYHTGWKEHSEHYKISNYRWAMYLRILKRYLELGEQVNYENRLDS